MPTKKQTVDAHDLLTGLRRVSRNLWWSWNFEAQQVFQELAPRLWETSHHNPSALLAEISEQEILARLANKDYCMRVQKVIKAFNAYMKQTKTWTAAHAKKLKNPVAYFSAEFGFHESLRTYSGGLGILAGDHTKSASDLGVPFIGITLFYRQGYFEQRIGVEGWQQEQYIAADTHKLPIEQVCDEHGVPVMISVQIGFSIVKVAAWKLMVGRSTLYMLDTNLPQNEERFRDITAHVYGGDSTTRISQEIVLGIGGVRMLRALGITPSLFHMNEGHSAFLTIELLREQIAEGHTADEGVVSVTKRCAFTTHTPVPAGHDRFNRDLIEYAFGQKVSELKMSIDQLMAFGRINPGDAHESFCMTVLALKMSRSANGVSELHGHVSREMWKTLYPHTAVEKVPIGAITNGVHIKGWANPVTDRFWSEKLGADWDEKFLSPAVWKNVVSGRTITDEEFWALRYQLRRQLIEFARFTMKQQHMRYGNGLAAFETILNPDVLTIGFARRFATYKRAPLLFTHFERTLELFNDAKHPIQLIFAGKAHPRDDEGKKYIQRIVDLTKHPQLFGKVIFLENYDINVARHLISGADVWLNNPRRPLEASGTSGQKVSIHGGLNCSIMDGWWREAYDGTNGWSIGGDEQPASEQVQDEQDSQFLYDVIKNKIIPEFYTRNSKNIPMQWIKRMRRAIATLVPQYNTHRMVSDYVKKYYL
ncbi:MAG: alpha-glucan family phosphorylase [Acidobacteriota bacterium]